jgi:hypothetical protein
MLTIFYNTRCPVCNAGINAQQNKLLQLVKSGQVEFRDINLEPEALSQHNASLERQTVGWRRRRHSPLAADPGAGLAGAAFWKQRHAAIDTCRIQSVCGTALPMEPREASLVAQPGSTPL